MARFGIAGQRPAGLFSTGAATAIRASRVRFKDLGGDVLTVEDEEGVTRTLRLTSFGRGTYNLDGTAVSLGQLSPSDSLLVCSTGEGTVSLVVSPTFGTEPPPVRIAADPIPVTIGEVQVSPPRGWAGRQAGPREVVMRPRRYQGAFRPLLLYMQATEEADEKESPFLLLGERPFRSGAGRVYLLFHAGQPLPTSSA